MTAGEHTRGCWQVCLSDQQVSLSVQNYRLYIVFQFPHGSVNTPLRPHIFCLWVAIWTFILTIFFCFFSVICWSYLWMEISVTLSTGNKSFLAIFLYFSLSRENTLLMLSCDRTKSAKFIHGTPSPAKPVYYSSFTFLVCCSIHFPVFLLFLFLLSFFVQLFHSNLYIFCKSCLVIMLGSLL